MEKRPTESCENTVSKKCRRETPIPDETTVENDSLPSTSDFIPSDFLLEDDIVSKLPFEVVKSSFLFIIIASLTLNCADTINNSSFPYFRL